VRPLFDSYRKVVAAPDYLAQHGMPQNPSELERHCCLGYCEPSVLNVWDIACDDGQAYTARPKLCADSCETVKRLCLSGQGIASLPDFMVDADLAAGRLTELFPDCRADLVQRCLLRRTCRQPENPGICGFFGGGMGTGYGV